MTRLEPLLVILEESDIGGLVEQLSEGLEKDPELFSRMLQDGEAALSALREASEQGPALVTEGRETLQQLRSSLSQVQPLLQRAEGISEDLELAAEDLPGLTEQADPLLEDLRAVTAEIRALTAQLGARDQQIGTILDNLEEIDKWELRRLLREEGIKVRIKEQEVIPSE